MGIDKIGFGRPITPAGSNNQSKENRATKTEDNDRVELSEEAKLLFAAEKAKKIGTIRAKVQSGFYNSPEVTERVVEGIIRDLQAPPRA